MHVRSCANLITRTGKFMSIQKPIKKAVFPVAGLGTRFLPATKAVQKKEQLLKALQEVRGSHRVTSQNPEEQFQALERYGRDLTEDRKSVV